jgi:antibiotic biosynthesis monooxygenase (ABM) superfamily enzyme
MHTKPVTPVLVAAGFWGAQEKGGKQTMSLSNDHASHRTMSPGNEKNGGPVTVVVSYRAKAGRKQALEAWIEGICHAAQQFEGHLGVNVLKPTSGVRPDYIVIFRFESEKHLRKWEDSKIRQEWLAHVESLSEEPQIQKVAGLEYWFTLPHVPAINAPPRYKMAMVTFIGIFPLSILLSSLLGVVLGEVPVLVRGLITAVLLVVLMTYVVMPNLTRLFARWLFR